MLNLGLSLPSSARQPFVISSGAVTTIDFISAEQVGGTSETVSTTSLTLTFDVDPVGLSCDNITVTGATKGACTGTGTTRSLAISDITVENGETVSVAISDYNGYTFTGSPQTAVVYKYGAFIITVKTDNAGSSNSDQFTIPTDGTGYNYGVRTSDGQDIKNQTGNCTITFPSAGTYTLSIYGAFPTIYFNNTGDRLKLLTIAQWGTQVWETMIRAFNGCSNLTFTNTDNPNFSQVTTMQSMFNGATSANPNTSNWNTSNVTIMQGMFFSATSANPNTSNWNTSKVINMSFMFQNATSANPDVSNWNTSKVTTMQGMFNGAASFKRSLANFKLDELTNAINMLLGVNINVTGTDNYDATLVAWAAYTPKNASVTFNGGNSKYSLATGKPARDILTGAPNNWSITDGGQA